LGEIEDKLALTPTQARLLRERTEGIGPPPLVAHVELDGAVDGDRLDLAGQQVQRRHSFQRLRLGTQVPMASDQVRPLVRCNLPGSRPSFQIDVAKILAAAAREKDLSLSNRLAGAVQDSQLIMLRLARVIPRFGDLVQQSVELSLHFANFGIVVDDFTRPN